MRFIKTSLFFLILSCQGFSQQKELQVNGIPVSNITCADIKVTKAIPEISQGFISDIRDAQIIGDCLELTVVYGGCNGNLELMTDSVVTKNSQLNFKLRWIEPSLCKALILTKVAFDLKPYKELIKEKSATIKIMGTTFELYYNN
ncbi:MAG: hypothetical protein H7141_10755 [Burkholderiales bacterium]|nr:hypothetical protein [Bacteroidia bacterium]